MKIYNSNVNQHIRDHINRTLGATRELKTPNYHNKCVAQTMEELKEKNTRIFKNFLGVIFADYYKMLYSKKIDGKTTDEEEGSLIFFDSLRSIESLYQEVEILPELLIDFVNHSLEFNSLNYFEKREIFIKTKDKNDFLQRICPGHFLDQLFHCQRYDTDKFLSIYDSFLKQVKDSNDKTKERMKNTAIETLTSTYEELKVYDFTNIEKLGYAMIRDFYTFKKYQASQFNLSDDDAFAIESLETLSFRDLDILTKYYDETGITKTVIKGFIEYNTETDEKYKEKAKDYLKNNTPDNLKIKLRFQRKQPNN